MTADRTTLPRGTERQTDETAPNARWMNPSELREFHYKKGDILLGSHDGQWIGSNNDPDKVTDDRHLITVAGSRAGKSSTVLKPNLKLWQSSVLCIDPKGELASETAATRAAMGHDVYILDPFNEVKGEAAKYRAAYNPFDELLAANEDDIIDDAGMIAEAMITNENKQSDHWQMSAKNLIRGLTLYSKYKQELKGEIADMLDVRKMLTAPMGEDDKTPDEGTIWLSTIFKLMMNVEDYDGVIAGVGGTMKGKPQNERGSIISTAVEQTSFLDSTPMQEHLEGGDLKTLRVLKRKPTTIYLVLPASRMATHFRWLRLILTLALSALEREPMKLNAPVLFVLEEFPQLGYMRQIEAAAGLMAGYGCKLHTVLQDLSQIKTHYPNSWETFIGNAGVVQVFGNTDATTLEYISRTLGNRQTNTTRKTDTTPSQWSSGNMGSQENPMQTPLLAPFEIAQYCARKTGKQIIIFAGEPPAYIDRISHQEVDNIEILN